MKIELFKKMHYTFFLNQIGKLDPGNYKLVAEGLSGLQFTNETSINLQAKLQSVFIQTDKAMYKPGDKLKFRVLVLDSDLVPATINRMNVFITVSESIIVLCEQFNDLCCILGCDWKSYKRVVRR